MNSFLIALIGGLVGLLAVSLAVLTGLRVIKVKLRSHKALGLAVLGIALLHGLGGLLLYLGLI